METLLVFLAIIAIQMIAAYTKQKKEAAKKTVQKSVPPPQATEPIPDPFREIREAMGLPSVEEPEELEELEELAVEKTPEPEYKNEGFAPKNMPFQSVTERKLKKNNETHNFVPIPVQVRKLKIHNAIDINKLEQGIIWAAILQQPRFKTKWMFRR